MNKYNTLNDEALIAITIHENKAAFAEIVKRYHTRVTGLTSRYVQDWNEVDDVRQDIFFGLIVVYNNFEWKVVFPLGCIE